MKASNSKGVEEEEAAVVTLPVKVSNLKAHKILANEICELGTRLYDSIGK
jgi:clusterin-associated protein 1